MHVRAGFILTLGLIGAVLPGIDWAAAAGDDGARPEACVWKGTVTIRRQGDLPPQKPKPEEGKTVTYGGSHTLNETIVIEVCGEAGALFVKSVSRQLQEDFISDLDERCHEALCMVPEQERKRPGHHGKAHYEWHVSILAGQSPAALREGTHVNLEFSGPQRFRISGGQTALADYVSDFVRHDHDACDGSDTHKEIHERTGPPGSAPWSEHQGSPGGSFEAITHLLPPSDSTRGFGFAAAFSGMSMKGSQDIPQPAGAWVRETAEWDLKAESPCPEVLRRLQQDLAFGETYADEKLGEFTDDLDAYEALVCKIAYKAVHGTYPPPGEDPCEVEAGTDQKGKPVGLDDLQRKMEAECRPGVIFAAISAHEDLHGRQKEQFPEYSDGRPRTWGLMEASAYAMDARMLLEWLKENCPGTGLGDAEKRLEKLERIGERYTPE